MGLFFIVETVITKDTNNSENYLLIAGIVLIYLEMSKENKGE